MVRFQGSCAAWKCGFSHFCLSRARDALLSASVFILFGFSSFEKLLRRGWVVVGVSPLSRGYCDRSENMLSGGLCKVLLWLMMVLDPASGDTVRGVIFLGDNGFKTTSGFVKMVGEVKYS